MDRLTRIGIFYDGNFFRAVSNYYAHEHQRRARIDVCGLHEFIRARVAHEERVDPRMCRVVDAHYFSGRFGANESEATGRLLRERQFEDALVRQGITTHFLPMAGFGSKRIEKGIDVWFALEAYEGAVAERFEVCVLIASDSDYVPLARKLRSLGTRVMVLGWDFDFDGGKRTTKTSQALLDEVAYPVLMSLLIEDKTQREAVSSLFLASKPVEMRSSIPHAGRPLGPDCSQTGAADRLAGRIQNLLEKDCDKRFGFIEPDSGGENVWFGAMEVDGTEWGQLRRGNRVSYEVGCNGRGMCAIRVQLMLDGDATPSRN